MFLPEKEIWVEEILNYYLQPWKWSFLQWVNKYASIYNLPTNELF